ncbi:MAG: DUF4912 domain-containing protein [Elainellaceae cyanobacterium]
MSQAPIPLEEMTLRQLRRVASEYGVSRYSRMRKEQLIAAIQSIQKASVVTQPSAMPSQVKQDTQEVVEAAKFDVGQTDMTGGELADVDEGLEKLPEGYGESRIVLLPRDPQWAYVYWDLPNAHKEELRRQGGSRLALRFYDVTDIKLDSQRPHSVQQYECDELAREWYLPIPVSDRDYAVEIGYLATDGRWLVLATSAPVRIPPVYPSDWVEDQFVAVEWDDDLRGKTVLELVPPEQRMAAEANPIYDQVFGMAQSMEAQRVAGSLFGSMHQVPEQAVSSYVFPSGMGMWSASGAGMMAMGSGVGMGAGMGLNMSGIGMSGIGMSGIGMGASMPPIKPRQFWLVADAELIVYGATEPDATVTIGGRPIKLNPDGTFRFQMSFQDGLIDFPIMAVAADGEQNRAIHMKFERETPERRTNTKAEAVEEWMV